MPAGFPPEPVYPHGIDSDYTLFLVHNTAESPLAVPNGPWSDEVEIVPVAAGRPEIWGDNGFANLAGELFYYDSVAKNGDGKVNKLKRCARSLGGKKSGQKNAGEMVRGFVVAEHHNQIVGAVLAVENFVGTNFTADVATLDWRIRNLRATPTIFNDSTCPDINFDFAVVEDDPVTGVVGRFEIVVTGLYKEFRLDFGDGEFTTSQLSGTHRYAPNADIDPVITVTNDKCQIVQSPVERKNPVQPTPVAARSRLEIPIPEIPDFPAFPGFSITVPDVQVNFPQIQLPCITLGNVGPINVPSVIIIDIPPFNVPSLILFGHVPSFTPIDILGPTFTPIEIIGPTFTPIEILGPTFTPIEIIGPTFTPIDIIGPTYGPIDIVGPTFSPIEIVGPTYTPIEIIGPTYGPINIIGPTYTPITIIGPTYTPIKIVGPTYTPIEIIGPTYTPIEIIGPTFTPIEIVGPTYSPIEIVGPTYTPINIVGPTYSPIFIIGPTYTPIIIIGPTNFNPIHFDSPPSFSPIPFGTPPSFAPIHFDTPPSFAPIHFDSAPSVTVNWGPVPTLSCVVTVVCPASTPMAAAMAPEGPFAPSRGMETMEINMGDIGIPSEIFIRAPQFPDVRLLHDLPESLTLHLPAIPDIRLIGPDVPLPTEIRIVNDGIPESIRLDASGVPKSIFLDASSVPEFLTLRVPDDFPTTIKLDASDLPATIQVVGVPSTIELVGPSVIQLQWPENPPEIPLVYRGSPIDVKVEFDVKKLTGADNPDGSPCFMLVPCK